MLRQLHPNCGNAYPLDDPHIRTVLAGLYDLPGADWVRINLVTSVNGSVTGDDGTSDSLTNRADRKILGVIRRQSDVILVGAASVRAEGYQLPRTAPLAIVTATGDFGGHQLDLSLPRAVPLVLCPAAAAERAGSALPGAKIVVVPDSDGRMAAVDIISALRERGLRRITCEGPSIASQLIDAGIATELCLSTSPVVGGAFQPVFGSEPIASRRLSLTTLLVDDSSTLYARWALVP